MRKYRNFPWCLTVLLMLAFSVPALSQNNTADPQPRGDNSKINQQDRNAAEPTADEIVANFRNDLENGKVTLKGPVRSEDEKAAVLSKATQVAGKTNINDEITVVPKTD